MSRPADFVHFVSFALLGRETVEGDTASFDVSRIVTETKKHAPRYPGKPFLLVGAGEPPLGAFADATRFISVIISA